MLKVKKLLVPIDFSDNTARALPQALAVAALYTARVTLLHVVEPILSPGSQLGDAPPAPAEPCTDALRRLKELVARYSTASSPPLDCLCVTGSPASCIVDIAENQGFGYIVMSTHGRRGIKRWVLGSVAERVVRRASCPVITIRPEEG